MTPKITRGGIGMMLRALEGEGIVFTKMTIGNGEKPENCQNAEDVSNRIIDIQLDSASKNNDYFLLRGTLRNEDIQESFQWTEIGVYCQNPEGGQDVMYAYTHYEDEGEGASPTFIPKFGSDIVELSISVYVYIGASKDVSAALAESAEYATKTEVRLHTEDTQNPHEVTKEQVGLGNVENVSVDNQTPSFTQGSGGVTLLTSGEKASALWTKVANAIRNLRDHINSATVHITTAERTKWNGKAEGTHNHSATQINSGTLSVARGGTGAGEGEQAMDNMGGIYARTVASKWRIPQNGNLNNYKTGGTYWCTSANVGRTVKNNPYTESNFTLLVFSPCDGHGFQMILGNRTGTPEMHIRSYNTNEWSSWKKL